MSNSNFTKKAIQDTFIKLLNERPLSKISVKDIVEECGINRNTFYYHYHDILELTEEIFESNYDRIVEEYPELNSFEECMEAVMEFAAENKRAVMHIYNSNNRSIYVNSLWRLCEHVVIKYLQTVFSDSSIDRNIPDSEKELVIRYFKCSCFGIIIDWVSGGMQDDYIESMQSVMRHSRGIAELLIENFTDSFDDTVL